MDLREQCKLKNVDRNEFRDFLTTYQNDMHKIWKFMKLFDDWLSEHRTELQEFYDEDPRKSDFIDWTRQKFYYFVFNSYKMDINKEIAEMLK